MNKKILSALVLLLVVSFGTQALASLTFTSTAITGTTASTIDLGTGNTLSLQTTTNAPITTGTGLVTLGGALNVTTSTTTPLIIGGTTTTSPLTLKTTTGIGTTNADIIFQVGNNGATEAMRILNSGNIGIGTTSPNNLLQVAGLINFNDTKTSTFIGKNAGLNVVAGGNTFIGYEAGKFGLGTNTNATFNTAIGASSLFSNTTGKKNVAIGASSLFSNTTGGFNVAIGYSNLSNNTTGSYNTVVGFQNLGSSTTGEGNTILGNSSLFNNTTGAYNIAIGGGVLGANTTGSDNLALGDTSLSHTNGSYNVAVGEYSLAWSVGSNNVALGYYAGAYEQGSNAFYVDNQDRTNTAGDKTKAILYGVMAAAPANQKLTVNARLNVSQLSAYANNTATLAGGLVAGDLYVVTGSDPRQIAVVF